VKSGKVKTIALTGARRKAGYEWNRETLAMLRKKSVKFEF
jgi:hypothetical protein